MKLHYKVFAIAVLVLAFMFAYSPPPSAAADSDRVSSSQYTVDSSSSTVHAAKVDVNTVTLECQIAVPWTRESVGKPVLNATPRIYEAVEELAGYRTVLDKPKISIRSNQVDRFAGFANTRAREQV